MERYATIPLERGGAWGVGLIGVALVGTAVVYGASLVRATTVAVYPVFDAVVLFVLGGILAAAGYRLGQGDVEAPDCWRISTAVGLGIISMATLTGWLLLAQFRQGVPVRNPLVTLAVTTTVGGVGGLLVGTYHVDAIQKAREARRARESARDARESEERLRFLTHLLRHHLLNGVQVIRSHSEFLAGHVDTEGETHRETIRRRSDRLVSLLENMRILVDSYEHEPSLEPVDLAEAVESQAAAVEDSYPGATVHVTGLDAEMAVSADDLLSVVFETLLETATERTGVAEPTVSITAERRDSRGVVTVQAPGPELDGGFETRLLDRAELREASDETRLGLYVSRRLVRGYGGDLSVDAGAGGPRYRVELPLAD